MLKPDDKMLRFLEWEMGVFLHFGIRTFHEERRDWDYEDMPVDTFAPDRLDCDQWARAIKDAGFSYAVMTAKHHDGFCLWQTEHSDYSVKNCAWRDGKGDVVRDYLDAMRAHGIKTGIYYSPADQIIFSRKLSMEEHNRIIFNHLEELCTNYGPIDYIWFDNCGSSKCVYEWDRIMTEIIDRHQPGTVTNSNGHTQSCWVGTEAGYAARPCMYVHDLEAYGTHRVSQRLIGSAENGRFWSPTEADCKMDPESWFYRENGRGIRSVDVLMGMYYYSVGRGVNLLLNLGPDREGLLPEPDRTRLIEFGDEIRKRFANPVAHISDFTREGDRYSITFADPVVVDHVVLQENIAQGHKVRRFTVTAQPYIPSEEDIRLYESTGIGHKAVCVFPAIYAKTIIVDILESEGDYTIETLDLYGPSEG